MAQSITASIPNRDPIQTESSVLSAESEQKTKAITLIIESRTWPIDSRWLTHNLGGREVKPLDFGPVDRGSNPTLDITFLTI